MKKKLHIYSQYYTPTTNAASNGIEKMVKALSNTYDITVVAGMPNYPTGIKPQKYQRKRRVKEE
jgi:hypothetical protein